MAKSWIEYQRRETRHNQFGKQRKSNLYKIRISNSLGIAQDIYVCLIVSNELHPFNHNIQSADNMQGEGEAEEGDKEFHTHHLYCECKRGVIFMPPTVLVFKAGECAHCQQSTLPGERKQQEEQEDRQRMINWGILTERVNMFILEMLHVQVCVYMW